MHFYNQFCYLGGEISVPATPSPSSIRMEWLDMIESGLLLIGEPCSPYTVTKYISKEVLQRNTQKSQGEKFPYKS